MEKSIAELKSEARAEHDAWVSAHPTGDFMAMRAFCPCGASSIPLRTNTLWPAHAALKAATNGETNNRRDVTDGTPTA